MNVKFNVSDVGFRVGRNTRIKHIVVQVHFVNPLPGMPYACVEGFLYTLLLFQSNTDLDHVNAVFFKYIDTQVFKAFAFFELHTSYVTFNLWILKRYILCWISFCFPQLVFHLIIQAFHWHWQQLGKYIIHFILSMDNLMKKVTYNLYITNFTEYLSKINCNWCWCFM